MDDLNWSMTSNGIVIFRETGGGGERSEVESHATSSGQLALLARLTHAHSLFLGHDPTNAAVASKLGWNRSG